jgi:hypothetical protein
MDQACLNGTAMVPRSDDDKEYFAQDWFTGRLNSIGLPFEQSGRNTYPDFVVGDSATSFTEGYEIKSLGFVHGRPARNDLDFNSTIPSGFKGGRNVFLVFVLYSGTKSAHRVVHTLYVAHADLINADHSLADEHLNVSIREFGSYADGFIRNRKMYVFPHPAAIDPTGLGKRRLIAPRDWNLGHDVRLKTVGQIARTVAHDSVDSYTIQLRGRQPATVKKVATPDAGNVLEFDVFEAA